nr:hypothetical protein CFP56_71592 [Quercus suber]
MKESGCYKASSSEDCANKTSPPRTRRGSRGGWDGNAENVVAACRRSRSYRHQHQRSDKRGSEAYVGLGDPARLRRATTAKAASRKLIKNSQLQDAGNDAQELFYCGGLEKTEMDRKEKCEGAVEGKVVNVRFHYLPARCVGLHRAFKPHTKCTTKSAGDTYGCTTHRLAIAVEGAADRAVKYSR